MMSKNDQKMTKKGGSKSGQKSSKMGGIEKWRF